MTRFGEIININKPVLIKFYTDAIATESSLHALKTVSAALGDSAKVIKIDVKKNEFLAEALRVNENPTFMIYKDGVMKWREAGVKDTNALIGIVQEYV